MIGSIRKKNFRIGEISLTFISWFFCFVVYVIESSTRATYIKFVIKWMSCTQTSIGEIWWAVIIPIQKSPNKSGKISIKNNYLKQSVTALKTWVSQAQLPSRGHILSCYCLFRVIHNIINSSIYFDAQYIEHFQMINNTYGKLTQRAICLEQLKVTSYSSY